MKIVHIAPGASYTEGWGYQENLLTKYQAKLGYDVTLIVQNVSRPNKVLITVPCEEFRSQDNFKVIRRAHKPIINKKITRIFTYLDVYEELSTIKPDLIFFHGLASWTIFDAIKYKKKNPQCLIVQDNHLDYNIGFGFNTFTRRGIRAFYRFMNKRSIKYVEKVYGVTPWRKQYAEDYFRIPKSKTDVLIMGADDEQLNLPERRRIREKIREELSIREDEFVVITGGKIDKRKKIDVLMRSCSSIKNIRLIVFGDVLEDVKEEFYKIIESSSNIDFIGWLDGRRVYDYFYASDLVFFPGQHSVLWEQACASKVPCVFEKWEGMDHVNNGGNSDFITPIDVETIKSKIEGLIFTDRYYAMKSVAESEKTDIYLYSNIAKKSVEVLSHLTEGNN